MSSNSFYLKLEPIGSIFFGGSKKGGLNEEANYYVNSRFFPQQTSILGMLRFLLLQNSQQQTDNPEVLIGATGFRINHPGIYGIIEKIYPVHLVKRNVPYFQLPISYNKELSATIDNNYFNLFVNPSFEEGNTKKIFSYKDSDTYLNYDLQVSLEGEIEPLLFDKTSKKGFFIPYEKIGIKKNKNGAAADKAFFKLKAYKLIKGAAFAFRVDMTQDQPFKEIMKAGPQLVYLGGERSSFLLTISDKIPGLSFPAKIEQQDKFTCFSADQFPKIALISDAFVNLEKLSQAIYILGEGKSFRHIQSCYDTKNHAKMGWQKDYDDPSSFKDYVLLSEELQLLRKGSVLYFKTPEDRAIAKKYLSGEKSFRTIGCNEFVFLN